MIRKRVFIAGAGIITPLGSGVAETYRSLAGGTSAIRPLSLFQPAGGNPLPVGQVEGLLADGPVPRTHQLARMAADQAMQAGGGPLDLVVIGTTTGGMATSERLLLAGESGPEAYRWHSAGSVAEDIAVRCGCRGPVLTVSTACSSGAAAIALALAMLRAGKARRALAGGADSLCRLTYYGFNALQLIDPQGAQPLGRDRRGMTVAEGAALLLLVTDETSGGPIEILGAGLSCDAFHPTAPRPDGRGAFDAMAAALADAGLTAAGIDYIQLHGTGTPENDLSEARALHRLFPGPKPPLSSIKGACGHPLAAAGAVAAVVSGVCISEGFAPATTGTRWPDPALELDPLILPRHAPVRTVLSNAFGFGGNNAAIVTGNAVRGAISLPAAPAPQPLPVAAAACITGAGDTEETLANLSTGKSCKGVIGMEALRGDRSASQVRRLKYLPRLTLALAAAVCRQPGPGRPPEAVFFGTGWGALSETHGFLKSLTETGERFPRPTDFIGSVHNAPAGQVAVMLGATGANVTTSGGDCSFEQALLAAVHLGRAEGRSVLLIGADEHHEPFSALFDPSVQAGDVPSAGGGALLLSPDSCGDAATVAPAFHAMAAAHTDPAGALVEGLGGIERINSRFGLVLAGLPAADRPLAEAQMKRFLGRCRFQGPVIDYRRFTGEFASASAVAAVLGVILTQEARVPAALCGGATVQLQGKGALVLGFGKFLTAVEIAPR
ncbi:MAG: beta-ketoacyl synthase N-terminal-like domain-containing protein [Desulfobacterales bacterium]